MQPSVSAQKPAFTGTSLPPLAATEPPWAALLGDMRCWPGSIIAMQKLWDAAYNAAAPALHSRLRIVGKRAMRRPQEPSAMARKRFCGLLRGQIDRNRRLFPHQGNGDAAVRRHVRVVLEQRIGVGLAGHH